MLLTRNCLYQSVEASKARTNCRFSLSAGSDVRMKDPLCVFVHLYGLITMCPITHIMCPQAHARYAVLVLEC